MTIREAVESGDLDRLTRLVDGLCASRDWDGVVELRDRCRHALERGLQLWPAAEFAEYRLALEAPGPFAGAVLVEGAGRFALGPLWEVAASTHTWDELAPHVPDGPARSLCAHERVIRGEDLTGADGVDPGVLDLPAVLAAWEAYPPAEYKSDAASFPTPEIPSLDRLDLPRPPEPVDDDEVTEALVALAAPWAEQSNGRSVAVAVEGDVAAAIAATGVTGAQAAPVGPPLALASMAWTGASGGAYGRRRGSPVGRFGAWWAAAAIAGVEWPPDPGEFADAIGSVSWVVWEPAGTPPGWSGCIAAERRGRAWALLAIDNHRDEDVLA
jgi:hypothetical protein